MIIKIELSEAVMCALPDLLEESDYQIEGAPIRMREIQYLARAKEIKPFSEQEIDLYEMVYHGQSNEVIVENLFEMKSIRKLEDLVAKHFVGKVISES
ncbi:TPA: hypothetical protein ACX3EJ_001078 [Vibrio parahaemolyticus]